MISIRFGSFETNSSSVHALVIPKEQSIHIPKSVNLYYGGEFGWDFEKRFDTLQYVFDACVDRGQEEVEKLREYLKRKGVEEISFNGNSDETYAWGIDHSSKVPLDELFHNEHLLDMFIFGDESYIQTGNDNSGDYPTKEDYDEDLYDVLIKSNY